MAAWTGVGRYTVGLAKALARRDDLDVVCVCGHDGPGLLEDIDHVRAPAHPFSWQGARELASVVAAVAPSLTHCMHFPTPIPAVHPLAVTLHDLTPLQVTGVMPSYVKRSAYALMNWRATRIADALVCPSEFTARDVEASFPSARGKITVTGEGADDFAAGDPEPLQGHLEAVTRSPYVFSMGSTRRHKDLPTLLVAFASLAEKRVDLHLLLVGEGGRDYLVEHLPTAPDSVLDRIVFTGRVTDGQLRTLYAGAAVFVFPSLYEGFGLPPLEAMALGAPVVCAKAASLPEVVDDAAVLVEPGNAAVLADAIADVLDDAALRDRLVAAGLQRAATLTWGAAAEKTVLAYRHAITVAERAR
jgi:glycosyltransferase involved in cell wall biosynthesis